MLVWFIALTAIVAIAVLIGAEIGRWRHKGTTSKRTVPHRQPHLEDRIRSAFTGPREKHGDIFVSYSIWRRDKETRLELFATDPFAQLNEFTRCLIVRHLWRALESFVEGSVVVVDSPPQTWSRTIDMKFHDHGVDPWRNAPVLAAAICAPQFAKD